MKKIWNLIKNNRGLILMWLVLLIFALCWGDYVKDHDKEISRQNIYYREG